MQQEACEKHYYLSYDLQLFAKEGQDGEKTEEPTAKKLEDARKKGQVMQLTQRETLLLSTSGIKLRMSTSRQAAVQVTILSQV